eukprot:g32870.t1
MEVLPDIASVKEYAFPIAGMLLVLYPAALMAWTVIEGRSAPYSKEQEEQRRHEKEDLAKPEKKPCGEGDTVGLHCCRWMVEEW